MAKLLKIEKVAIIDRALEDTFKIKEEHLLRNKNLAAHQFYEAYFSEEERKLMKSLPTGWLMSVTSFYMRKLPEIKWHRTQIEPAVLMPWVNYEKDFTVVMRTIQRI